jgi:hypothetical protein
MSALHSNSCDVCLLVGVLNQPLRIGQIGPPAVRTTDRPRDAAALRLMPQHRGRCPLGDLLALQLSQR